MNILPYSAIRLPWRMAKPIFPIFSNPKTHYIINNRANFSQYFREKDTNDVFQYENKIVMNKKYHALKALWQKPLAKKRLRQARIKEIKANLKVSIYKFRNHSHKLKNSQFITLHLALNLLPSHKIYLQLSKLMVDNSKSLMIV